MTSTSNGRTCCNLDNYQFCFSFRLFFHTSDSFETRFQPGFGGNLFSIVGSPDLTGMVGRKGGDEGEGPYILVAHIVVLDQQLPHHLSAGY